MTRAKPSSAASLGELGLQLFREGTHARLHRRPGCHQGDSLPRCAVWAPNAETVAVFGDFNRRRSGAHPAWRVRSLSLPLSGQAVRHGVT